MERVLEFDPGVWVFALQYSTQKGRLLRSAVVLANHKDNIDYLKLEKLCSHGKFDVSVDTHSKLLCLWITLPVVRAFSDRL